MRRTILLLATMTLVVVASSSLVVAASSLNNGTFETGNLTGWSVDTTSGGNASAVASYDYSYQVSCGPGEWGPCFDVATVRPHEGSYFALLTVANQQSAAPMISQPFEASNGDKVSGWAFFQTDNILSDPCTEANDDKAQVVITSASGTTIATPFEQNIGTVPSPIQSTGGNSGWMYWEHTFSGLTAPGQFRIEARVQNNAWTHDLSRIGLDDVSTSTGGAPDTTPPVTYITSGPPCGVTPSRSATFEFHSNEQGSTFKCQLLKDYTVVQAWAACTSPKSYSDLSRHELWETNYRFEVQATDPAGNVDPTPASRSWWIDKGPDDTTAPEVYIVFPKENTEVDRTTDVKATFSEGMDPFSITTSTFKLFKKGSTTKIDATVSYPDPPPSPAYTAKLDPTNFLRRGVTYKAVVTTGAKDLARNPLAQQKTWFFTVR
jgi:Bacterial Ig-like domain